MSGLNATPSLLSLSRSAGGKNGEDAAGKRKGDAMGKVEEEAAGNAGNVGGVDDASNAADDEAEDQMLFTNKQLRNQRPIDRDFSSFVTNTMMKG